MVVNRNGFYLLLLQVIGKLGKFLLSGK